MELRQGARWSSVLSWGVILLASLWVVLEVRGTWNEAGSEKLAAEASVSAQQALMSSIVNGATSPVLAGPMGPQLSGLRDQAAALAFEDDPGSELASAAMLARLGDAARGLALLEDLHARIGAGTVEADDRFRALLQAELSLVSRVARGEVSDVPDEDRALVVDALGPAGRMLVAQAEGDQEAIDSLQAAGALALVALVFVGAGAVGLGLVGVAFLLLFAVLAGLGKTAGVPRQPGDWNHVYAEVFAVWLVAYMALPRLLRATLPLESFLGDDQVLALGVALTAVAAAVALWWGTLRGVPLRMLLAGCGLAQWRFMDIAWGVVTWAMGIVLLAAGVGIAIGLSNLFGDGSMRPSHPIQQMVEDSGGLGLACTYVLAAVSAPIFEELFFRGAMYRNLRVGLGRAGPLGSALLSIGISSVVFAAIHPQGLVFIPVLGGLAVGFCLMREWRGSINASIVAHALNNFTVLTLNVVMLRAGIHAG